MSKDPQTDYREYAGEQIMAITEALTEVMLGNFSVVARTSDADDIFGYLCAMVNVAINSARNANDELRGKVEQLEAEVSERLAAQAALLASEEQLRITLNSIGDAVIATDRDGIVTRLNPVGENLTGYTAADAEGLPLEDIFKIVNGDTRESIENPVERVIRTGQILGLANHTVLVSRDTTEYQIADSGAPIRNSEGAIVGVVIVFRDVTEQYRLENQLRQSQKMELVGQLAGGVAHDFNNMLGGIVGAADLLAHDCTDPTAQEHVEVILSAADRATSLIDELLAFSRKSSRVSVAVDVHEVIGAAFNILERSIDRRIVLESKLEAAECVVFGDPALLQSAILNLAVNAGDAMPDGGTLSITTDTTKLDEQFCGLSEFDLQPGRHLRICVRDTGVGIGKEHLGAIFEPFFTTKGVGEGTGLGLAAVYGTALDHNGAVFVESVLQQGTVFEVLLPLSAESVTVAKPTDGSVQTPGHGCVLVVDDEAMLRDVTVQLLSAMGYQTLDAEDGVEALKLFADRHEDIDLVLLDMMMPRMSGVDCLSGLRDIEPDVPVVLCSGYTSDRQNVQTTGPTSFLKKPYRAKALSDVLVAALAGRDRKFD